MQFGFDWTITYYQRLDDSTGGCTDYNETMGTGSGHMSTTDANGALQLPDPLDPGSYLFNASLGGGFQGTELFFASGPAGCDHVNETQPATIIYSSQVTIPGPNNQAVLTGTFTDSHDPTTIPTVHTYGLTRHFPGT